MMPVKHLAGSAPRCSIKASQTAPGPVHGWAPKPCGNEWRDYWKSKGRSDLLPGAHRGACQRGRGPPRQRATEDGAHLRPRLEPTAPPRARVILAGRATSVPFTAVGTGPERTPRDNTTSAVSLRRSLLLQVAILLGLPWGQGVASPRLSSALPRRSADGLPWLHQRQVAGRRCTWSIRLKSDLRRSRC